MSKHHDSTKADLRFLQNLAYLVPGYRAYRDVTLRRGEDSRMRARVLAGIKAARDRVRILQDLWETEDVDPRWIQPLIDADKNLTRLAEELRYCCPRAENFFLAPSLSSEWVDEILEVDLLLLEDLESLGRTVYALPESPPRRKGMKAMLDSITCPISNLSTHLVWRDGVLGRENPYISASAA
ncbi:MAG: hypothetical protein KJ970_07345 [Candidatus Eisenbacteria bacterium]|uniref:Uncharacterized protein n=1 Tax=Eiseniibacteriota bacterium TaxID=2212470 RepID=A0A948WC99_UNCEI|nr:hypothetical protein [Candidatus Eisenbacteria bacterium]MBU1947239.1 hypothetical protein [Candidatus Eisenbacteria bacterium]MBU2690728.1 hypothetical protein [Candidatus Eisenbacteria bacterium]